MNRIPDRAGTAAGAVLLAGLLAGCSSQGQTFDTREAAAAALIGAMDPEFDIDSLAVVLGAEAEEAVGSGDAVQDREHAARFVQAYRARHAFEASDDGFTYLVIGDDDWPFAIPLTPEDDGWRWDLDAGRDELLSRRIGANELDAIEVCLAIVDAQIEYASRDRDGDGLREYAGQIVSTLGSRDGLFWPTGPGDPPSPLGGLAAEAADEGYGEGSEPGVYHGYRYRMLTAQSDDAPGGAQDYVVDGNMIGGFALIAWPATYGNSGIMTFIVNHDGVVYDRDLGRDS
ncbi:MAG: DUF2950 domain-containing protein, partial [Planctomycetota bacterium]